MEPSLVSDGRLKGAPPPTATSWASMEPSLVSDGRFPMRRYLLALAEGLQWSRRWSATDAGARGAGEARVPGASMEPSLVSDGRPPLVLRDPHRNECFNGAVAGQRRTPTRRSAHAATTSRFNGAV